jgi:ABC-type multidrug transport system fused ATPase/permease subunit
MKNTIISMQYGIGIIPFTTFDFPYKSILFVLVLSSFLSLIISVTINTKNRPQLVTYSILIYLGVFIIYYFLAIDWIHRINPWINGHYLEVLTNWFSLGGYQLEKVENSINGYFTYSAIFIIFNCLVKIIFFIFCFKYLFLASKDQAVKIKEKTSDLKIRFPVNKKIAVFVFLVVFVFGASAIRNNSSNVYEGPEDVNQAVDELLTRLNSNRNFWEINELSTSSTGIYAKKRLGLYAQPDFVLQCNLPYSGTWLFLYSDEDSAYDAFNSDYFFRTDAYSAKFKYDPKSKFLVMLHTSAGGTPECLDSANSQLEDYATDSN